MAQRIRENSGTSKKADSTPTPAAPTKMPMSAVTIGSPLATTDPKATSNTMMATLTQTLGGLCGCADDVLAVVKQEHQVLLADLLREPVRVREAEGSGDRCGNASRITDRHQLDQTPAGEPPIEPRARRDLNSCGPSASQCHRVPLSCPEQGKHDSRRLACAAPCYLVLGNP